MYFSRSIIASALLGFAAATTHAGEEATGIVASETLLATATEAVPLSTGTGLAGAPAAGMVNTHVIQVGGPNGTLEFLPPNIQAKPGDFVQFQFNPKNHSVAESTFAQPCVPIQNVMANKTDAFWSGFMPASVAAGNGTGPGGKLTYTIRVKDEKPIWFYCSQGQHCQNGMAGAINAPLTGNRTVEAFQALAANAPENLSPGQSGGGSSTSPSSTPGDTQNPGTEASNTAGGANPTSTTVDPAQQSVNAAPALSSQSYFGLGLAGLAALFVL